MRLELKDVEAALQAAGVVLPSTKIAVVLAKLNGVLTAPLAPAIEECLLEWKATLRKFGVDLRTLPSDKFIIGRMIQQCEGDPEPVKLAIYGARFEEPSNQPGGFNPAQHLSLERVFRPGNFARLMAIGSQRRNAHPPTSPQVSTPKAVPEGVPMTDEARAMLKGLGFR